MTSARNGRGTIDCHRGRIAHKASTTRPTAPVTASGLPNRLPSGFDDIRMCGASRTSPVIASRRCQIAARSMPSNHSSTHGKVLISTKATEKSRTASAPKN